MRTIFLILLSVLVQTHVFSQMLLEKEFGSYNYPGNYTLDSEGNIFSTSIVTEAQAQNITILPGAYQNTYGGGGNDVYIEKRSPDGTLLWNTFFGGENTENGGLIATEEAIYLTGGTRSTTDIATPGTFLENYIPLPVNRYASYIAKFDLNGQKIWGTYYRTTAADLSESVSEVVINETTNGIFIVGTTQSQENVSTNGAFDPNMGDADTKGFIAKFDDTGNRVWGTYYGTSNMLDTTVLNNITIDSSGNLIIGGSSLSNAQGLNYFITNGTYNDGQNVGPDIFMAKFNPNGERIWGLMYGGLDFENTYDITVDSQNNIIWQGSTRSLTDISTPGSHQPELGSTNPVNGTGDSFLAKFDTNGQMVWATYYGGQLNDSYDNVNSAVTGFNTNSIALDEADNIYFSSITKSENNIATLGTYQDLHNDPNSYDGFATKFTPSGERIWGTYFGGEDNDYPYGMLYAGNDEFYIYGSTQSISGIATPNGWWQDEFPANSDDAGFIMKFRPTTLGLGGNILSEWTLSPNPAKDYFQINGKSTEPFSVRMFDVQGRIVKQWENAQIGQYLKTETMSQGLYFVNIKADNNQTLKLLVE